MIRQCITVFLMLIWCTQMFSRYVVMAEFYINQSFIAANLCENRDKPQLNCNGKCQLSKRLKAEQRKDAENPERKAENKSEIFYPSSEAVGGLTAACQLVARNYQFPICIGLPVDQPGAVFRPPSV